MSKTTSTAPKIKVLPPESSADMKAVHTTAKKKQTMSPGDGDDDAVVQRILADSEMRAILLDPAIQQLIEALKNRPETAQRLVAVDQN